MAAIGSLAHAVYPPRPIVYPYSCLPCLYSYCLPYPVDGVFEPPCAAHPSRTRGCEDEDHGIRTSGEPSRTTPKTKLCTELLVRFPWFSHLKTLSVSLGYQTDGTLSVEPDPGLALDVQVGSMRR